MSTSAVQHYHLYYCMFLELKDTTPSIVHYLRVFHVIAIKAHVRLLEEIQYFNMHYISMVRNCLNPQQRLIHF